MSESPGTVAASDVRPGDRVRMGETELVVARVESPFLGMDAMVAFIEDTPERWHKTPLPAEAEVVVVERADGSA
jgi:hypothetical protein